MVSIWVSWRDRTAADVRRWVYGVAGVYEVLTPTMLPLLPLLNAGELPAEGKSCKDGVIREWHGRVASQDKWKWRSRWKKGGRATRGLGWQHHERVLVGSTKV